MKKIFLGFLLLLTILFSCQKVINIPVSDTKPKLVIEANYDAVKQEVIVDITKTKNVFSADTLFGKISATSVEIIDVNGTTIPLYQDETGSYVLLNYAPIYDSPYTMNVTIEGVTYSATDTLFTPVPIDSLTTVYQKPSLFYEDGYLVFLHFVNPEGTHYYRVMQHLNGEKSEELGEQLLFSIEPQDNPNIEVPIYWRTFEPQDTVQVDLITYSKKSHQYYTELFDIISGSEFSSAPANPKIFWTNNTSKPIECLGHFTTFAHSTKEIIIGQ